MYKKDGEKRGSYNFRTDQISYETVETKAGKKYFVTGYISVPEVDMVNDLVTQEGLKDMLNQINERTITLDYEHEAWRDDSSILPVGKIVQARIDDRGLWVKAELNPDSPKFKDLWNSVKGGFVTAFSIAFKPVQTLMKTMGETRIRVLNKLHLLNVALTGNPVNRAATITEFGMKSVMLKAIEDQEKKEVKTMDKNLKSEEPQAETKEAETKEAETKEEASTSAEESSDSSVEEKGMNEAEEAAYKKGYSEGKKASSKNLDQDKKEDEKKPEGKSESADLKAFAEKLDTVVKENAELKSKLDKIEQKGVFKSPTPEQPEIKSHDEWFNATVLGMIR